MKYVLEFSGRALADLEEIKIFISCDSPERAQDYALELWRHIQSLKTMPNRCPVAPESGRQGQEIRHLVHGPYRVLFTVGASTGSILRVIHGARIFFELGHA